MIYRLKQRVRQVKQWFKRQQWSAGVPAYVTRQNADGIVGTWNVSAWFGLAAILLVMANVLIWGVVGIVVGLSLLL